MSFEDKAKELGVPVWVYESAMFAKQATDLNETIVDRICNAYKIGHNEGYTVGYKTGKENQNDLRS